MIKMEIGIIGFGQLGQFMAKHLKPFFSISIFDVADRIKESEQIGVRVESLEKVSAKDIVILAVPINKFEELLNKVKNFLKPGALLLDVCSVKVVPASLMSKIKREDIGIIAMHPLFGPQSGANGIKGLKIVLCPIRISKEKRNSVKQFLEDKLGLKVIITTPEKHDGQMAIAACLSHFIGRALINLDITEQEISEPSFNKLLELKKMLEKDSFELFRDIQQNNPFAKEIREKLCKELGKINSFINEQ
jgi:prephenate dehydrogenase